jgi:hypothetical protein
LVSFGSTSSVISTCEALTGLIAVRAIWSSPPLRRARRRFHHPFLRPA